MRRSPLSAYQRERVSGGGPVTHLMAIYDAAISRCERGDGADAATLLEQLAHSVKRSADETGAHALIAFYVTAAKFAREGKHDLCAAMLREARQSLAATVRARD